MFKFVKYRCHSRPVSRFTAQVHDQKSVSDAILKCSSLLVLGRYGNETTLELVASTELSRKKHATSRSSPLGQKNIVVSGIPTDPNFSARP